VRSVSVFPNSASKFTIHDSPMPPRINALLSLFLLSPFLLSACAGSALPASELPGTIASPVVSSPWAADAVHDTLGPGVIHIFAEIAEGPWAVHVIEIDTGVCGVQLIAAKGMESVIGRERTTGLFERFSESGRVAVAVNADFFRYAPDGVPEGPQVSAGEVVVTQGTYGPSVSTRFGIAQPVFGVTSSGRAFIGEATISGQAWTGSSAIALGRLNATPGPDSLALFNRYMGGPVTADAGERRVELRVFSRAAAAGDVERGIVVRVDSSVSGEITPGAEVRALAGSGRAAAWLRNLSLGDTVNWHLAFAGAPGAVREMVGGFPLLILDGRSVLHRVPGIREAFSEGRHPRTAVGIRSDGRILIVVVDGRQPQHSVGMSLPELTTLMLQLGASDAVNLDGGGSTTLVTTNGIVNRPSDSEERPVANGLVVRAGVAGNCSFP
jgi:hypothetical protein